MLSRLLKGAIDQAAPTPVYEPKKKRPSTKKTAIPPTVATNHKGSDPSVQRRCQETAGRPSGRRSGIRPSGPLSFELMVQIPLVEEVAGKQHSSHKNQQKT